MPTAAMEDQYGIALRIFGAAASADLPLPPISDGFRVDRDADVSGRLLYIALTDQSPETVDAALAQVATHPGIPAIVVAVGEKLVPDLKQYAKALSGMILCPAADHLLAPLSHLVSVTGLIGLDITDTLSLLRRRIGSVWEGRSDQVSAAAKARGAPAISFAFSPRIPSLPALEAVVASIDPQPDNFTVHLNTSLTDPDQVQMLLMED